jgi:hypothetical protein
MRTALKTPNSLIRAKIQRFPMRVGSVVTLVWRNSAKFKTNLTIPYPIEQGF